MTLEDHQASRPRRPYHPTFRNFQDAIPEGLDALPTRYSQQPVSLMTPVFEQFEDVSLMAAQGSWPAEGPTSTFGPCNGLWQPSARRSGPERWPQSGSRLRRVDRSRSTSVKKSSGSPLSPSRST